MTYPEPTFSRQAEEAEPVRTGDAGERLGDLFDQHHPRLYRLARRMVTDAEEARDLVQEAFLRAARRPKAVPAGEPDAEAWLVRVVVNLCRDRRRRAKVRSDRADELPNLLAPPPAPESPEGAAVARATVEAALAELAPRRRAVVVLAELEGLSTRAIARLLSITQVTVRWHLAAGRKALARQLLPPDPQVREDLS